MAESNLLIWLIEKAGFEDYANEGVASVLGSIIVLFMLVPISLYLWRKFKKAGGDILPSEKVGLQNIFEVMIEWLLGVMKGILGNRAEKFLPLIGTLFVYILFCDLLGFIPGLISPTSVVTTNLGCALVVFVYYNYVGIREHGFFKYLRSLMGPVIWLAPLLFLIELTSHFVRPISLSVRLYGNMMGDHVVVGMFTGLIPIIVPVIFMALGVFVAFIQAFVFSILSTVYIALAIEHE